MNAFFSSVFTQEDVSNMPDFERRPYMHPIENMSIKSDQVEEKLKRLTPPNRRT